MLDRYTSYSFGRYKTDEFRDRVTSRDTKFDYKAQSNQVVEPPHKSLVRPRVRTLCCRGRVAPRR